MTPTLSFFRKTCPRLTYPLTSCQFSFELAFSEVLQLLLHVSLCIQMCLCLCVCARVNALLISSLVGQLTWIVTSGDFLLNQEKNITKKKTLEIPLIVQMTFDDKKSFIFGSLYDGSRD